MKSKDLQPRLLCLAKLSFRIEGQMKCFPDKVKLKGFIITKPLLYEMLKYKKKIKTVNIKLETKSQPSIIESKIKLNKQNRNRIIDIDIIWRVICWKGKGENRGKG